MQANNEQDIRDNFWDNLTSEERSTNRNDVWMRRSGQWHGGRFGIDWQAEKLLGQGQFGICGLFKYIGDRDDMPERIVVKQSGPDGSEELMAESQFLQHLSRSRSIHVLKLYASCISEPGTGTHPSHDPPPPDDENSRTRKLRFPTKAGAKIVSYKEWKREAYPEVSRIYLEYCDLKNMYIHYYTNFGSHNLNPSEDFVWRLWECLARALVVLEHGAEDAFVRGWTPILHLDTKPANFFVKNRISAPPDHTNSDVFKMADFGFAQHFPGAKFERDKKWIGQTAWRGTGGYQAPEQAIPAHTNRLVGLKTDIWGVAATMYSFVLDEDGVPLRIFKAICGPRKGRLIRTTAGRFANNAHGYSERFRKLLLRCLAYDPVDRPDSRELLKEIQKVMDIRSINLNDEQLHTPFEIINVPITASTAHHSATGPTPRLVFVNPAAPRAPPAVNELNLFGANEPAISDNEAGGKGKMWVPLPRGPADPNEAENVMIQLATAEYQASQGIIAPQLSANYESWIYLWVQKLFKDNSY